jgi:hypothetical protein
MDTFINASIHKVTLWRLSLVIFYIELDFKYAEVKVKDYKGKPPKCYFMDTCINVSAPRRFENVLILEKLNS